MHVLPMFMPCLIVVVLVVRIPVLQDLEHIGYRKPRSIVLQNIQTPYTPHTQICFDAEQKMMIMMIKIHHLLFGLVDTNLINQC